MNIDLIKKQIDNIDVLFTDIFDTVIYRTNYPDYNKQLWCYSILKYYKLNISLKKLVELRYKTEISLRKKNLKLGYDYEFRYDDLLNILYKKLKIKDSIENFFSVAKELEVNIESNSSLVCSDTLEILNYCHKNKKKVICISDMYLSKDMIISIFKKLKIDNLFYDINISSESLLTKSSGNLYKHIKEKYKNIDFNKVMMIGDNYKSDYTNAFNNGISATKLDRWELENKYKNKKAYLKNKNYIKQLRLIKEAYKNFDVELDIYFKLVDECVYLFTNNISKVTYSNNVKNIIDRLKILNSELYFTNNIEFVNNNKNSLVKASNNTYVFPDGTIIDEISDNLDCFKLIVRYLANVATFENIFDELNKNEPSILNLDDNSKDELTKIGKSYFPIFEDFAKWINDSLKKNDINKIYFFTREGEFFKEVFDKIKDNNIKSEILEVSRVATFFPSFEKIDLNEMNRLWSQYKNQSLYAMFKSLNIDDTKYIDIIYKHNLSLFDEVFKPSSNAKIIELFNDKSFIKLLSDDLKLTKENLFGYFKEKGFVNTNEKVAIVDIGWRGTIQDNICKIFNNKEIYGYYFGLQKYLNEQQVNSHKFGYINQYYGYYKVLGDVTPFEMLCNSPNGSTISYEKIDGKYKAIRKIDEVENKVYYSCTKYIQDGILSAIGSYKYNDTEIMDNLEKIIYKPSKLVTKAYFNLKHNEEFGLGEFVSKNSYISSSKIKKSINNSDEADKIRLKLQQTTWPNGYLINNGLEEYIDKLPLHQFNKFDKLKITKKIAFILPDLLEGSGGHRTIIENANYLAEKGYLVDLYFNEDYISTSSSMIRKIEKLFGRCLCQVYIGLELRCDYDMIFATYNVVTPDIVMKSNCPNKMYFVQDFEPWFNSMGDGYINAENTYKYGLRCITIGNWLSHKLANEFNLKTSAFPFCANLDVYHQIDIEKEDAICFIFQPDKPRRCVELGLKALKIVKKLKPNIKIYLYGSKWEHYVDFDCENLHIISIDKCNELYNKCKVGLCISSSNPSRIPFEMMASGLPVVDVYRENNLYDMPSDGVTLAESTPESIANEIIYLLDNPDVANKKREFGIKYMSKYDLKDGFEIFYKQVKDILDGKDKAEFKTDILYKDKPREIALEVLDAKKQNEICVYRTDTSDYYRDRLYNKIKFRAKLKKYTLLRKAVRLARKVKNIPKKIKNRIFK